MKSDWLVRAILIIGLLWNVVAARYDNRCSSRLEAALDQMRKRQAARGAQSKIENDLNRLTIQKSMRSLDSDVVISELRVRMPSKPSWVRVDRCSFNADNSSLDTKLLFPDLTISGSVSLRPRGATCNMVLRLRRAGIRFTTRPLSRSEGTVSVRTDSQFTEPGFLSVFAHGCEVRDYHQHRRNSKYLMHGNYDPFLDRDFDSRRNRNSKYRYGMNYFNDRDEDYNDDYHDRQHKSHGRTGIGDDRFTVYDNEPNSRQARIFDVFESDFYGDSDDGELELGEDFAEDGNEVTREMEDIFSKGIRGLLTSYMQRALQPAIKETLMSSMGYTISYG